MISISRLNVSYGKTTVLQDFSLDMDAGEIYALVGPSGCGKSTLLRALCGIVKPDSGKIEYKGERLQLKKQGSAEHRLAIGYVPQHYGLLDWKTVKNNILLPLQLDKTKKCSAEELAEVAATLGLETLLDRFPIELSGGQRQRVALARAFISQPDLLLLDEAFSALDAFTAEACQDLFLRLWHKRKITTLFITHNIHEAVAMGRKILLMRPLRRHAPPPQECTHLHVDGAVIPPVNTHFAGVFDNPYFCYATEGDALSCPQEEIIAGQIRLALEIKNCFKQLHSFADCSELELADESVGA